MGEERLTKDEPKQERSFGRMRNLVLITGKLLGLLLIIAAAFGALISVLGASNDGARWFGSAVCLFGFLSAVSIFALSRILAFLIGLLEKAIQGA
jgi:hypothetical protein